MRVFGKSPLLQVLMATTTSEERLRYAKMGTIFEQAKRNIASRGIHIEAEVKPYIESMRSKNFFHITKGARDMLIGTYLYALGWEIGEMDDVRLVDNTIQDAFFHLFPEVFVEEKLHTPEFSTHWQKFYELALKRS